MGCEVSRPHDAAEAADAGELEEERAAASSALWSNDWPPATAEPERPAAGDVPDLGAAPPAPFVAKATRDDGTRDDLFVAGSGGMSPGALAGVVAGSGTAVLLAALIALVVMANKRRGRRRGEAEEMATGKVTVAEDAPVMIDDFPGRVPDIAPSATFEF